jgi:hypothetical protein
MLGLGYEPHPYNLRAFQRLCKKKVLIIIIGASSVTDFFLRVTVSRPDYSKMFDFD